MGKLSKLIVLLFAIVLSYVSTSTAFVGKASNLKQLESDDASAASVFSGNSLNAFCLFGSGEHVANPANNFPTPNSKKYSNGFLGSTFSFEAKILNLASQYLLHAKEINLGLTIRDIIFPFHYFW